MWSLCSPTPRPSRIFERHGPADDVARGEVLGVRSVALHEPLALGVRQVAAFSAGALGDEAAGAVDAGGVELDELHVLQRQAGPERHRVAVAGAGVGGGAREVGAAVAAGGEHRHVGADTVQGAVVEVPGEHSAAGAVVVGEQVDREVLDEELGIVPEALLVEGVQDGVTGAVRRRAGPLGGAFPEVGGHPAERALVDAAVLGAGERDAEVLQLDHGRDRLAAHVLDRVLIAEPVRALHGVVHVPAPVVLAHVAERGTDASLGRDGVAAGGEELGHAGGGEPLGGDTERRPQARAARADHDDVVLVLDDGIGRRHRFSSRERP